MKPSDVRYYISKVSIYTFAYCSLFLIQRYVVFCLFDVKQYVIFERMYAYEIILALITAVEVYKGIKISRPE